MKDIGITENGMRIVDRNIVGAVLVSKDGKVWMGLGDPKGVYGSCWKLPGGGIDEGETPLEAVRREVIEETGINIFAYPAELISDTETGEAEKTLKTGERVLVRMRFWQYTVKIADKDASDIAVALCDEFSKCCWYDVSELKDLALSPPSTRLFTQLGFL